MGGVFQMMDLLYSFRLCVTLTLVIGILMTIWDNYRLKIKIEKLRRDMDLHFDRYNEDIIKFGSSLKRMKNAGKSLFKDRLIQSCRFFIEQEKINYVAKENIKELYCCYTSFVPDDIFVKGLYDKCMQLPVVKENKYLSIINSERLEAFEEFKECQKILEG